MAKRPIEVETLTHDAAKRPNIPTAEYEFVMAAADKSPVAVAHERRKQDLAPQRGMRGCGGRQMT